MSSLSFSSWKSRVLLLLVVTIAMKHAAARHTSLGKGSSSEVSNNDTATSNCPPVADEPSIDVCECQDVKYTINTAVDTFYWHSVEASRQNCRLASVTSQQEATSAQEILATALPRGTNLDNVDFPAFIGLFRPFNAEDPNCCTSGAPSEGWEWEDECVSYNETQNRFRQERGERAETGERTRPGLIGGNVDPSRPGEFVAFSLADAAFVSVPGDVALPGLYKCCAGQEVVEQTESPSAAPNSSSSKGKKSKSERPSDGKGGRRIEQRSRTSRTLSNTRRRTRGL